MTKIPENGNVSASGACYDLEAGQSFAAGDGPCQEGGILVIPATPDTKDIVEKYLNGAKVNITVDENGHKTIMVKGFDAPDQMVFINPQPPPQDQNVTEFAKKDPPRRVKKRVKVEKQPERIALPLRTSTPDIAEPALSVPPDVPLVVGDMIVLSAPTERPGDAYVQTSSGGVQQLMEDIARSSSRMQCGEKGCVCEYPPCIPCSMENMALSGKNNDQWAAFWILWYSKDGTFSERMMAIRSMSQSEKNC